MKRLEQTFPVKLFDNDKGPLKLPSVLPDIVKRLDADGRRFRQSETKHVPIFSKYESNILTMVTGGLICLCVIVILIIVVKQIRLQSLVSSLGLVSLIPPTKAFYLAETFTKTTETPYFLASSIANEKVVCLHPLLTALGSAIAICGAIYAAYQVFRSLSWYHRYKNSRCCTMYFFHVP